MSATNEDVVKELETLKVGQSDERTIYEVLQRRVMIEAMDYHSMQMSGGVGALDDGMVQQRLHALVGDHGIVEQFRDPDERASQSDRKASGEAYHELPWGALDDVVMGGVSESGFQIDRTSNEHGRPTGVFRGF
ncbi:hypothetical protein Droror1_Dr00026449 [Drosera rotundifolia]